MTQLTSTVLLRGGLNLVTPAIAVPPGMCIAAKNYEPDVRGYRRIGGFEIYDGRPRPSEASYWILNFDAGTTEINAGDTVTGASSTATGVAVIDGVVETGTYGGSDAAGYVVLYGVVGTFVNDENLQVSASTVAVANGAALSRGADNDEDDKTWYRAAVAATRVPIAKPAGSGPVRGVWTFDGDAYCFRDNAGATACVMFKATTSGWVAQTFGHTVDFTLGGAIANTAILEGDTLTKGSTTATVRRVVRTSGSWAAGTAAGYLVVSNIASGPFTAGAATTTTSDATLSSAEAVIALPAGGSYHFTNHNFYGAEFSPRMYGVNGVGRAFMWDGTYMTPIRTDLTSDLDKPTRIAEYANHLFLGYSAGTVNFSSIGEPLEYDSTTGAGTFAFGGEITAMLESASTALLIFGRGRASFVTGTSSINFRMDPISDDAGAIAGTVQMAGGVPIYMDEAGLRRLNTTQAFGSWRMGTITEMITPFFKAKQDAGVTAVASIRNRARDQYKLFFSDGTGLTVYLGRKTPEVLPFDYGIVASCSCAAPLDGIAGQEIMLIGATDGGVYQLDVGTSFNGAEVQAFMLLPFNSVGTPTQRKRFHRAALEIDAGPDTDIGLAAEFDYGSDYQPPSLEQTFDVSGGGGFWNASNWNDFQWSTALQGIAEAYISGIGRNCAIGILSDATHELPHTLSSLTLNYMNRGLVR